MFFLITSHIRDNSYNRNSPHTAIVREKLRTKNRCCKWPTHSLAHSVPFTLTHTGQASTQRRHLALSSFRCIQPMGFLKTRLDVHIPSQIWQITFPYLGTWRALPHVLARMLQMINLKNKNCFNHVSPACAKHMHKSGYKCFFITIMSVHIVSQFWQWSLCLQW